MAIVKGKDAKFYLGDVELQNLVSAGWDFNMEMEEDAYIGKANITKTPISDTGSFNFEFDYDDEDVAHIELLTPPYYTKKVIKSYPSGIGKPGAFEVDIWIESVSLKIDPKGKQKVSVQASKEGERRPIV